MARSEFAVLIPAHNEATTIGNLVSELLISADVVVVDDGSQDQTSAIARSGGAYVISFAENRGYDKALAAGIDYVKTGGYSGVVTCDADGQHLVADIVSALQLLQENPLIVGVRKPIARISERLFAGVATSIFDIVDPLCGLKGYQLEVLPEDFHRYLMKSSGTGLALKIAAGGIHAVNMPISVQERASGAPRFGGFLRANLRIFVSLLKSFPLVMQSLVRRVTKSGNHGPT